MVSKIQEKMTRLLSLVRNGRYPQAVGYASQFVLGRSLYVKHLETYLTADDIPVQVEGNTMFLSPKDPGISSELFHFGSREPEATEIMRREFERIGANVDEPVVLEIGANRGYYAFLAADTLGDDARILAFEPDPSNFEGLCKGIEANRFDTISPQRIAVGDKDTTETLNLAASSNSHTLQTVSADDDKYTGETVQTPVRRIQTLTEEADISPGDVDIVRMDIEGYESAAFDGMRELLATNSDLLVFVELHPHRVPPGELAAIVSALDTAGFEFVHASSSANPNLDGFDEVQRHLQTPKGRHTVELIARRKASGNVETVTEEQLLVGADK